MMEVADRTEADRKGGHVARRRADGRLLLREVAQTPDEDLDAFQDVARHRYFNTNTIWLDLRAVAAELERRDGVLGLPLIRNRKTVDPSDRLEPRGLPDRDRDGRGARRHRGRAGAARAARRASRRSRRPTTCSRCARTPTSSPTDARVVLAAGAPGARRSSTSTPSTSSSSATSSRASRPAPPSLRECDAAGRPRRRDVRRRRRGARRRRRRGARRPGAPRRRHRARGLDRARSARARSSPRWLSPSMRTNSQASARAHHDRLLDGHQRAGDLLVGARASCPRRSPRVVVEGVERVGREGDDDAEQADAELRARPCR